MPGLWSQTTSFRSDSEYVAGSTTYSWATSGEFFTYFNLDYLVCKMDITIVSLLCIY